MTQKYSGIYSIPVTPFNEDRSVDYKSLRSCIEFLVEKGSDGILLPVNVSEASKLSDSERDSILSEAVKVVKNKIPIIAGVSGVSSEHVVERSKYAEGLGITSIMAMPPLSHSSKNQFIDFYSEISKNVEVDIWIQNNKPPAGPTISNEVLAEIINGIDRVNFLKEESDTPGHIMSFIRDKCKKNIQSIMGGAGGRFSIDEYRRGADGIMPSGHMVEAHKKLWLALTNSERNKISTEAIEIWNKMLEALNFEFMYSVTAYKYFFWKRGIIRTNVSRNPAKSMDYFDEIEADRILKNLEIHFF